MDPDNVPAKFEVRSFTRSWDNSDWSFGSLGGSQGWYRSKEAIHEKFSSILRVSDIVVFVLQHATFPDVPWE